MLGDRAALASRRWASVYAGGEPLAEVVRSGFVEGRHRGSVVGARRDRRGGRRRPATSTAPIFPRSSNKPMQAIGMLRAGLRLADPADLALVAASHSGEDFHVARVAALLRSRPGWTRRTCAARRTCRSAEPRAAAVLRAGGGPSADLHELLRQARRACC